MAYTILVADPEQGVVDSIEACLKSEGYAVSKASTGAGALDFALNNTVDLALVGRRFDDIGGAEVCARIKQKRPQPIIMLETKDSLTVGHAYYADGRLVKPIAEDELRSLVRAHLEGRGDTQGASSDASGEIIEVADLAMDRARRTCIYKGAELHLTPKEFDILWKLAEAQGKVVSNHDMYRTVWGEDYFRENDNTIAVHIRRLRKKMKNAGTSETKLSIETAWGSGYKLSYSLTGVAAHSQKSSMLL